MASTRSSTKDAAPPLRLQALTTPCLVVDADRMDRNIDRLRRRLSGMNTGLRPHLKTSKSVDIARRVMSSREGPATVSTIEEAERFVAAGVRDLIYAVGIAPAKLTRVTALLRQGVDVAVLVDCIEQAHAVANTSRQTGIPVPVLIEIDCDGRRSGVSPNDGDRLTCIARVLEGGADFRGVLTHAGGSYEAVGAEALQVSAETERRAALDAAAQLHAAGFACRVVSIGSTPTAHLAVSFEGITEVRAGVFVFFDLVQAGLGVCGIDDIALSVLATVIGVQRHAGRILVDAGWMALSSDRGLVRQAPARGYGLVCNEHGVVLPDLIVSAISQEHGVLVIRPGSDAPLPDLRLGDRVRILPQHACATAAQHERYFVVRGASPSVEAIWPRIRGW